LAAKENSWLEEIRKDKKLTRDDIATGAGITPNYYSMLIGGRRPSVKVAKRVARVMGFDWTLFYEGIEDEVEQRENTGA
jgi:transcriptional regulator with XRE-family HTH domain